MSMTEVDHCAENAQAERMNGILKQEYFLSYEFRTVEQARRAVDEAVCLYNTCRPHRSLKMKMPAAAPVPHLRQGRGPLPYLSGWLNSSSPCRSCQKTL